MTKGIVWKKNQQIHFIFDSIVYVLSHATKMQLFLSQLKTNDVLQCVLIFDYSKYYFILFFEII
jgi:hypothetical protein